MKNDNCKNGSCSCISDVSCGVKSCAYHTVDDRCVAERINVKNENAQRMAETFCGTFTPRTSC